MVAPATAGGDGPSITQVTRTELHVMTFNLRYGSDTPPNSWPERRPVTKRLLLQERPHIIGTQEGLNQQLRDISSDLPSYYDSIGEGRDGGSRGKAMQGEQFNVINTHLEAFSAETRAKSADLILERMQRLDPELPVLMTCRYKQLSS